MDMWSVIAMSTSFTVMLVLLTYVVVQRRKGKKSKHKEALALKGVEAGIGDRLHAAHPGSKWKWICYPAGLAISGGIARIEVCYISGKEQFMDVCVSAKGYMALHVLNVAELNKPDTEPAPADNEYPADTGALTIPGAAPLTGISPHDEESVGKWFNIVLIDALTGLIDDLNASGEVCLQIGQDGKAYTEENGVITTVYDFGEMPDMTLWGHIIEELGAAGLFAEVQEGNCIFISWI